MNDSLSACTRATLVAGTLHGTRAAFGSALLATAVTFATRTASNGLSWDSASLGALALVWVTALTSWATTRSLYTAIHWAWTSIEQAEHNLKQARDYQGRLAAAVRQLEEANYRLERANYALAWAQTEADHARRLKAQFAAHVSHELRTPINLIVGFAELMLNSRETYDGVPFPKAYLADFTAIYRNARHLGGLIDDILDLSQIDVGEMPVLKDIADVAAIVHEAVATTRQLLERKGLAVGVEVSSDLPLLRVDRLRIRQVLLNLLNNAVRFTDSGGVTVRAYRRDAEVTIEVSDTGVGVRPQDLGKLFEPFHQVGSAPARDRGGTGLGLVISKRFVELHGGRIWVKSEGVPGRGSTFGISLPVEGDGKEPREGQPFGPGFRRSLTTTPPLPTLVVLDDDPAIASLLQRHLEGYLVASVANPNEAVSLAVQFGAHAIITDIPEQEDLSVWHRHWSAIAGGSGVRVLGCPMPSGRRAARALGLVDYLVKPVTREALLESVRRVAPQARTILVVDDDAQMVRLLCRMLRSSSGELPALSTGSLRLMRAYDGEQALQLMRRTTPDLVLLDLLMPRVDGLAVLDKMKLDSALTSVPVVAVSAKGAVEAVSPSRARAMALVVDEPFQVAGLVNTIRSVLDTLAPLAPKDGSSAPAPPPSQTE